MPELAPPPLLGTRGRVLLAIAVAGLWAAWQLELTPGSLVPGPGGLRIAARFFGAAVAPAFSSEVGDHALLPIAATAAWRNIVLASAAIGVALLAGMVLAFLGSLRGGMANGPVARARGPRASGACSASASTQARVLSVRSCARSTSSSGP